MNIIKKFFIKKLIKSIDKDIKVKFHAGPLECDIDEETVYIGTALTKEDDNMFLDFCGDIAPDAVKYGAWLIGILHEVFHIETYDEDDEMDRDEQYAIMKMIFDLGAMDAATLNRRYFELPLEYNATMGAIGWIREHRIAASIYKALI